MLPDSGADSRPNDGRLRGTPETARLPAIPLFHTGPDFPIETTLAYGERGYDLLALATAGASPAAIRVGDAVSRAWLRRSRHPFAAEIETVARVVQRPGTHFFNDGYEWGCTTAVKTVSSGGGSGRLVRVLDWRTRGLGRHVVAARVACALGPWLTLTWPGYTGVLQAVARGRFAAGLNQAPARADWNNGPLDWLAARIRVWRSTAITPAHLLRQVFETSANFTQARERLVETPLAAPVIFTLAGPRAGEACVIERQENSARVLEGKAAQCANDWQTPAWQGRRRPGRSSAERLAAMQQVSQAPDFGQPVAWLGSPILNEETRVALLADPAEGRIVACGYEDSAAVTAVLDVTI